MAITVLPALWVPSIVGSLWVLLTRRLVYIEKHLAKNRKCFFFLFFVVSGPLAIPRVL